MGSENIDGENMAMVIRVLNTSLARYCSTFLHRLFQHHWQEYTSWSLNSNQARCTYISRKP